MYLADGREPAHLLACLSLVAIAILIVIAIL